MYNIFVDNEIISENVPKADVSSKVRIIEDYFNTIGQKAVITVVLNKPEAIA